MSNGARRRNTTLWLIIALAAAPAITSYLVYFFWPPTRTVNYGDLIEPRPLPDPPLLLADGTAFQLSRLRGKWVLVSLDSGRCDAHCDRKLLYMRQLRLTQGKEMERVERAWLVVDDVVPRPDAVAPYTGTWVVRAAGAGLLEHFPAQGSATDHIYVIDPLGNLMMRFPQNPDPARMIKDLSRLLRASRIG